MTGYESKKASAQGKIDNDDLTIAYQSGYYDGKKASQLEQETPKGWKSEIWKSVKQQEQEPVTWGVDWGKAGDIPCVSIIKRVPNGGIEVMAVEYAPYSYTAPPQPAQEPVACDGDFPEGFDASLGVPAQALRVANAIMCDVIGKREWDVPCTAQHVLSFAKKYTTPSQRTWVDLTDEDIHNTVGYNETREMYQFALALIAKLKEKNSG